MLSKEENALLTRVGQGTPMGELFLRFWLPALLSSELAEPDSPPVRLRLLGEDLVAFHDTDGRVGIIEPYCAHKLAHLFWGRNEEQGLRCTYHGWKYDVDGNCVDIAERAAGEQLQEQDQARCLPDARAGRRRLGLYGSAGARAAWSAADGVGTRPRGLSGRHEMVAAHQLGPGHGG